MVIWYPRFVDPCVKPFYYRCQTMKMVFFSQQWLWRVLSAWMWCHVIFWKCTSVLGGPVNSIFRIGSATWHCIQGDCNPPPPPDGATARGGPWPPLRYASRPLDYLLCLSICLHPSFSGPWTRHPFISFLVFLFVLLLPAFCTTSFLGLQCLAFFLYDQAIIFFGIQ